MKEKFKQRKQKKLYGTCVEKNNKKLNDNDNENSLDYSDILFLKIYLFSIILFNFF